MHELSIALSILDELEEQSRAHAEAAVTAVYVRLGVLSGVDGQALRFAFELAREGTAFAGARLEVESVPLRVLCPQCARSHSPDPQHIFCPKCLTPEQQVLEGRELEVAALELAA